MSSGDARQKEPVKLRARTGVPGLDDILNGGLPIGHLYLIEGDPGAGKTTVGLQFLMHGAAQGEPVLYVTLSESKAELESGAESTGGRLQAFRSTNSHPLNKTLRPKINTPTSIRRRSSFRIRLSTSSTASRPWNRSGSCLILFRNSGFSHVIRFGFEGRFSL